MCAAFKVFCVFLLVCREINTQEQAIVSMTVPSVSLSINLCSVCTCSEIKSDVDAGNNEDIVFNIQCSELDKIENLPDLNKIEWPDNPYKLKITASFEGLGLTTVGKLPANDLVDILIFDNNAVKTIWPQAFSELHNLRRLSFSQNDLTEVTPDLFNELEKLEVLDLSYNKLTDFNQLDFANLKSIRKINLQSNLLKSIPLKALEKILNLEELDLSKNGIFNLQLKGYDTNIQNTIKRLNLNGNEIPHLLKDTFPELNTLESLDLSNNLIANIEEDVFVQCKSLRELNLAQNKLSATFALPSSLQIVTLNHNNLQQWPTFPSGITYIDLSYNELVVLYDEHYAEFESLEILNIAGNQLTEFKVQNKLPRLYNLDLSYNFLQSVPQSIDSRMLPALEQLRLDGNPLHSIMFPNKIALRALYMNDLSQVTGVEANAFTNMVGRSEEAIERFGTDRECINLYLSNCKSLGYINEKAFSGTSLCFLDISSNNLTSLSENLMDWTSLREGLNLQRNPWDCQCHLQWLLEKLLPEIYTTYPSYLYDLRCESPRARQGLRLVHWYNWNNAALCSETYLQSDNPDYLLESTNQRPGLNILSGASSLALTLGVCIIIGLLVTIVLSVYLVRSRRSYKLRRAINRKRQTSSDVKEQNGEHKEQFSALNKV